MNLTRKIDLALEARELALGDLPPETALDGVTVRDGLVCGLPVTHVQIETQKGAEALGKPPGAYYTLSLPSIPRDRADLLRAAEATAGILGQMPGLPRQGLVLAAGLGNREITPDALGPLTMDRLLVTRHLTEVLPMAKALRPVAAMAAGVSGSTGIETGELLRALVEQLHPVCLIAVDALAARHQENVCRTIQISDTGIIPGSGVGNARLPLTEKTLGVPVLAVGVPTVVDAATLCLDLMAQQDLPPLDPSVFRQEGEEWFLTPRTIGRALTATAQALGLGISQALHRSLTLEEIESWLA